ncbi:unnamed protein product [Vitrella brassicaformis CCMP3155]|uniref:Uncharacterized protein n=1 Tax=Vitrella brassicaformis (strain CCMP3155) TaxID=1169540 RepID=A0A0G4ENQ8_VITBC|nr:unnamed protein product [Vitrella brassicaformis CCMP3155]|eukprot:CEL98597.1 unnamed protein product [Vitrella brassicaformis CCMP3155]
MAPAFDSLVRSCYVLEQGDREWRVIGIFIRLAAIYRLTPDGLPLVLSVAHLHSKSAFDSLPLAIAIYRLIGHQLTHRGQRLALQQAANGEYQIARVPGTFRVVSYAELPANHRYAEGYQRTDPVIRRPQMGGWLYSSFSAFLLNCLVTVWHRQNGVTERMVVSGFVGRQDSRYVSLLTGSVAEEEGIVVDSRVDGGNVNWDHVTDSRVIIIGGYRAGDAVAASVSVGHGDVGLYTTEMLAGASAPLDARFPVLMDRARRLLRRFNLENGVISRGTVMA